MLCGSKVIDYEAGDFLGSASCFSNLAFEEVLKDKRANKAILEYFIVLIN